MTREEALRYCLTMPGAYLDHPFGPDSDIVKVQGKIFAQLFCLRGAPMLTVNGDAITNDFYRRLYPGAVTRGYHCPPVQQPYFNTVDLDADVPDSELTAMIGRSYRYVVGKLPRRLRAGLDEGSLKETK